ncbi:MAG: hypothetical protein ACOYXT_30530, partial [Bacteroidota bacterium]
MLGLPLYQQTDIPVFRPYLNKLEQHHVDVACKSKWLNAVSAHLTPAQVEEINALNFVDRTELIHSTQYAAMEKDRPAYLINNYALKQTNSYDLVENKLTGSKVTIGIIDGNFFMADSNSALTRIFKEGRVLGKRDFIDGKTNNFFYIGNNPLDIHATVVWQMIAGYEEERKTQYGLATGARFYLARTDERGKENQKEEDHWIEALEWMDSLGVRLVHSSLCYALDFDDPSENHSPDQMDGQTTAVSKAARIGAEEKG